ncbi:MAG: outer membrane protein assembly factor BamA [Parvibaculaceae bacterium]|nr:outer membrane protein assembly factor BamA [Parvibaculaceae bacterium]
MTRSGAVCGVCLAIALAPAGVAKAADATGASGGGGNLPGADAPASPASEPGVTIQKIEVVGNQRIEADTVISYMSFKVGDTYSASAVDDSLKALFVTGLFADVNIRRDGSALVVSVVENPVINRVAFEGNSAVKETDLKAEVQLQARTIYTRAKVQSDVERILNLYRRSGRFSATVDPKVIQLPQNRVDLVFEINEGPVTKIGAINFLGNSAFSDSTLRDTISTTESAWWKFFSSSDSYDPDRLNYDRELLRRYYLSHGYADFRVVSAVAELSRDDSAFYITFTVDEGPVYNIGTVSVDTKYAKLDKGMLEQLIQTRPGDIYNASLIDKTVDAMTFKAGSNGYAFAQIRPRIKRNREKRLIDIVYEVNEGPRVYVERINITGNVRTLDRVIRREMVMAEGDAFNKVLLDKSEKNIRALQYFSKVDITQEPGSTPDKTVIGVNVQEQSTGSLSVGLGYSTIDSVVTDFGISERNFLGRGQQVSVNLSLGARTRQIDFHFTEPFFLGRRLAAGFDLFGVETDFQDEASFDTRTKGFGLRLGFPTSEHGTLGLRYQLKQQSIFNVATGASLAVIAAEGSEVRSIVGYTYYYDMRNDPIVPTGGWDALFDQEFAGVGGSVRYLASTFKTNYYYEVAPSWVASQKFNLGYIFGIGEDVKLNDRYFLGGDDFRGFERAGIGPRDLATDDALGAQAYYFGTTEISFPNGLPESLGISTSLFTDYGYAGRADEPELTDGENKLALRASAGLSVYWNSPFGPVRLDFAKVIKKQTYDKTQLFQFSAGTQF